jgi:hypothetical protein
MSSKTITRRKRDKTATTPAVKVQKKTALQKKSTKIVRRNERIPELPEYMQSRMNKILAEGIKSPQILPQEGLPGLGIDYDGDKELGLLAYISTLGVDNWQFISEQTLALQKVSASSGDTDEVSGDKITSDLAAIASIAPEDALESMLAVQMVATHRAAMSALRQLNNSEYIDQSNSAANRATKLMNAYTRQVEALNKHRGKGQQKMTVEHVHVNEGGQAIIGTIEGGGGNAKK